MQRPEKKKALQSDPFYTKNGTDSYGYKVKVLIYPNGDGTGKNTHLSVFIKVIKGEYDAILPWPFKKKVKLELIDQQEDPAQQENVTEEIRWLDLRYLTLESRRQIPTNWSSFTFQIFRFRWLADNFRSQIDLISESLALTKG